MAEMYCPKCNQMVKASKFNWIIIIVFFIFGLILWPFLIACVAAIIFYAIKKPKCPKCSTVLEKRTDMV